MKLRILGCHGGSSLNHRNVTFLIDDRIALDAGSLAVGLTVEDQGAIETVLVTHSHLDHVGDLGTFCDTRAQMGTRELLIAGMRETIEALKAHFFNDVLWPDFVKISMGSGPTVVLRELSLEEPVRLSGLRVTPISVDHTVPSCGFLISDDAGTLAYTGDTGPTERFWEVLNELTDLRALITEISFPNRMAELALASGHLTPDMLRDQLAKLDDTLDVPIWVYGMKPVFVEEIESEMAGLGNGNLRGLAGHTEVEI